MLLLAQFFNWVARLLKALWLFFAGVASVGAIYYLLTGVEQGIDVVIQSGELLDSGVLSVLAVFLWAFLVWYSSRTLSYIKQHKDDEIFSKRAPTDVTAALLYKRYCIPSAFHQHIPRILAFNCFVSIQLAIFHLPTFYALSGMALLGAGLAHNTFYFLLTEWLTGADRRRKILNIVNPLVIAGYTTFLAFLIARTATGTDILSDPMRHRFWLSVIALLMFALEVITISLFIARRASIDRRRNDATLWRSRLLHVLGFNPVFNAAEAPYFNLLNAVAGVGIVLYVTAIFTMPFTDLMGPLAFTLLALGVLTGFFNLITLLSIRSSFNVMIILVALAVVFGHYRDPYAVRLLSADEGPLFSSRPDTRTYLTRWFENRMSLIQDTTSGNFPIYIILSNGGASRAGKWTSSVLAHLQDTSYRVNPRNSFKDHILCIAGASGGSVGNCAFYSLLSAERSGEIEGDGFRRHADTYFEADFLTYTLARMLGPDMFRHLIPFNIPLDNRADALEKSLAHASRDSLLNAYFRRPVTELFDDTGALPILFINTTQVDNGMPGVISNVKLPAKSQRIDVLSLVDSTGGTDSHHNMTLSTAAVLSSRFPYVSPAGKVFDRYYVDGGYFDNSGAGTVLEFIQDLNAFLSDSSNTEIMNHRQRMTFHILHITNSEVLRQPAGDIHPLTNDLLAPVLTLAGMQGSSTDIGDGMLINTFAQFNADTANAMIVYSLYDERWDPAQHDNTYEDGYPMSWALSAYQLDRMKVALQRANATNLRKFGLKRR